MPKFCENYDYFRLYVVFLVLLVVRSP